MKEIIIKLDDKYNIPTNIQRITSEEWEIILNYTSNLILKHDSITSKVTESDLSRLFENKYKDNISALENKILEYEQNINNLKNASENKATEYEKLLKKQRKDIEEQYKSYYADAITSIKASTKEIMESKDHTIQSLKSQMNDMIKTFEQNYTLQVEPLKRQIETLRKQLEDQYLQTSTQITNEKNKIYEQLESKYETKLAALRSEHTEEMTKANNNHSKVINDIIEQEHKRTEAKLNEMKEQFNSQFNLKESLIQTLNPLIKFYGGTNVEKGNGGESCVRELLSSCKTYDGSLVEDVSGTAASGDIIFTYKNIKCLIEVKNKSKITKEDIEKFIRDVNHSKESIKINCAMLISLQSNQFYGRTRELLQLDYVSGTPVIYTYMPPPVKEIHFAITCLERILQTVTGTSDYQELLQKHFVNYYSNILEYQKYFDNELKKKQKEVKVISKHLDHMNSLCEELSPIYVKISKTEETSDVESNVEEDQETIQETNDKESDEPLQLSEDPTEQLDQLSNIYINLSIKGKPVSITSISESCGVSKKIIEYIGFKKIASHAKQLYMSQVLTDSKLEKIIAFITANKRYPNRKEITSNKIIPDHTLRNIIKVTKHKKVTDAIENYIKTINVTQNQDNVEDQDNQEELPPSPHTDPTTPIIKKKPIKKLEKIKKPIKKNKTPKIEEPIEDE